MHGEVRSFSVLLMYFLLRKTGMRCFFYWLGRAWLFVQPNQFSTLPFDPAPLRTIFLFPLFLSICGIFVPILEEQEPALTGHHFQPGWSLQGSGWFGPFSFLSASLWSMFLLGFSMLVMLCSPCVLCSWHLQSPWFPWISQRSFPT